MSIMDGISLWLGKAIAEVLIALAVLALIVLAAVVFHIPAWWRQRKCDHSRFYETRSCDAVCSLCGADLGFIQPWREKFPKGEIR